MILKALFKAASCDVGKCGFPFLLACGMLRGALKAFFYDPRRASGSPASLAVRLANLLLAIGLLAGLFYFCARASGYEWDWAAVLPYWRKFAQGWGMTVILSLSALLLSTVLGVAFALMRQSRLLPLRYFSRVYVELIRGTPLLVQLLIIFYIIADGLGLQNRYVVGVIALSLFSGAYISEIVRAGIASVSRSQLDSARAIGLTSVQTYRYVIFPQAMRRVLPPMAGQFASLIKDSSLLSVLGIGEFTLAGQETASFSYATFESYLPLAVGYLLLTLPLSLWMRRMEERYRYET